jgi:uncharacterized protein YegL
MSGSMGPRRADTIGGFNSYVADLRKDTDFDYRLTTVVFADESKTLYTDLPLAQVEDLTEKTYAPGGSTALYDALGKAIGELTGAVKTEDKPYGEDKVLVLIFTDGEENASRSYTRMDITGNIMKRQDAGNWNFVYLGVGIDGFQEGSKIGTQSTQSFSPKDLIGGNYFSAASASTTGYSRTGTWNPVAASAGSN